MFYRPNFVPLGFAVFVNYNRYFVTYLTWYENKYNIFRMDKMLLKYTKWGIYPPNICILESLLYFLAVIFPVFSQSKYMTHGHYPLYSYIYSVYYIFVSGWKFDDITTFLKIICTSNHMFLRVIWEKINPRFLTKFRNHPEQSEIQNFQPMQCLPILKMTCFMFRLISSRSGWFQASGWFHEKNPMFIKRRHVDFTQPCD